MGGQGCCGKREVRIEKESDGESEGAGVGVSRRESVSSYRRSMSVSS